MMYVVNYLQTGKNISLHMTENNLTQSELAKLLNISRQRMWAMINGKVAIDLAIIMGLAEIFKIPVESFVEYAKVDVVEKPKTSKRGRKPKAATKEVITDSELPPEPTT